MDRRAELTERLAEHYRGSGWRVSLDDGLVLATGPGGVTWIGAPVTRDDLDSGTIEARLPELAGRRMQSGGELCPLELLPDPECEPELRSVLARLGLDRRPHVAVYSLPAAA